MVRKITIRTPMARRCSSSGSAAQERKVTTSVAIWSMVAFVPSESARADVVALAQKRFGTTGLGSNVLIGTADELREHYEERCARGVERFYVWFLDFGKPQTLAAFGRDVIGAFA